MVKKSLKIVALLAIVILMYVTYSNYPRLTMISGYSAKNMSSSVFIANRSLEFTDENDNGFGPINIAKDEVDLDQKIATASVYGLMKRKAIYREGLGSVLVPDDFDENQSFEVPQRNKVSTNLAYPYGESDQKDTLFTNVNYEKLAVAVHKAFDSLNKTRSVLVIYKDHIIAEEYGANFNKSSKILGWSMTKSITSTIYGILQKQGKLDINDTPKIDAWKNDDRSKITLNDLLHMNSGLEWEEDYSKISDVTKMLFLEEDMGDVQIKKPRTNETNNAWNYSSGTSNLLSKNMKTYFDSNQEYLNFWYSDLIDRIGMHSMVLEADLSSTYVGSSYGWATTRDWAKFGLLYLHRGNWNGDQLFNETWVDYVKTPTNSSSGRYGGHFWLNAGGYYPDAPREMYSANGFQGQRVFIIPSKELVIVRMGLDTMDFNGFLKDVLSTISNESVTL